MNVDKSISNIFNLIEERDIFDNLIELFLIRHYETWLSRLDWNC